VEAVSRRLEQTLSHTRDTQTYENDQKKRVKGVKESSSPQEGVRFNI